MEHLNKTDYNDYSFNTNIFNKERKQLNKSRYFKFPI